MKRSCKLTWCMKLFLFVLAGLLVINFGSVAHADWSFGIGTGIFRMGMDGDMGLNMNIAGPVEFDVDLDPDDISDMLETAFGFSGYATDRKWTIQYSFGMLELEDDPSVVLPSGVSVSSEFGFEVTGGEITVGYPIYHGTSLIVRLHGGVRYTEHELDADTTIVDPVGTTTRLSHDIDEDWTDALVGISVGVPLAEKWMWNNKFNAGFGGSEGTYFAQTGITWRFLKHWSATLSGKYTAVEFENGDKGDSDWYLYDVDEFGLGIGWDTL